MTRCKNDAACHNPCLAGCDDYKPATKPQKESEA